MLRRFTGVLPQQPRYRRRARPTVPRLECRRKGGVGVLGGYRPRGGGSRIGGGVEHRPAAHKDEEVMPPVLTPTNMTMEEMVPETGNPAHNPRYWCLPPVRDEPSEDEIDGGEVSGFGTIGPRTLVKAMVSGYPSGAQRGHHTMQGCIAEWQQHCPLGVHPHPADPAYMARAPDAMRANSGPSGTRARPVDPRFQAQLQELCMPNLEALSLRDGESGVAESESSLSSPSSLTAMTWEGVPPVARYFVLWGGCIVYTDRRHTKAVFLEAEALGKKPRIMSTADYDKAQAFSESVHWL
ncbi:hypothetical protein B0H14DRAFT_2635368 [Mycena olivaceomarginata]|nr:hypothetical protein B0H14DRAFT_2635368 [Mycena olivaceomarginata]